MMAKMKAEMKTNLEAKNNEKFEVLQDTLITRLEIYQARTGAMQERTDANLQEMKEEIMANLKTQVGSLASRFNVNQ
jgi:hypothetical protein